MDGHFGALQTLKYNTSDVMSCDFGGSYQLAIGSSDKTVRVLEWKQGLGFIDAAYSPLPSHKYGVTWVRFSPQGTMLASSSVDGTTVLWNVKTGTKINTMVQATRCSVRRCEFTPDSTKLITAGDDGVFSFWDLVHRKHIKNHFLHDDEDSCVQGLSVSPDSEYMITGDTAGLLKIWPISDVNVDKLQCLFFIKNVHDGISCCEFSPNREISGSSTLKNTYIVATCGSDNVIKLWEVIIERGSKTDGESELVSCDMVVTKTLEGHLSDVHNVRFNTNGLWLASTGLDKAVKLWQVKTGECLQNFDGHSRYGNCVAFSKDSTLLASGSNDRTVIVWDLQQNLTLDAQLIKPCSASCHFTHNPVCSLAEQMVVHQAEADSNRMELLQTLNLQGAINSVHFYGNNILATAGGDKIVSLWERKEDEFTFDLQKTFEDHRYSINQLEISPCGTKIISCSMDGVIIFWDLEIGLSHEMRTPDCTNSLRTARFSPSSQFIAAAGDDQIVFLWDAKSLEFIKTLQDHKDAITSVAFTPDSRFLASTCCAGDIKIYNLETDECSAAEDNAHDLGAMSCDFSFQNIPRTTSFDEDSLDQEYLLASCGNDSLVKVWTVQSSEISKYQELTAHGGNVNYVRFSPSIPYLLVSCATDNTARIWNAKSGICLHVLEHHESMVTTCSFSEDSTMLATGSLDKRVMIWSLPEQLNPDPTATIQDCRKILQNWTTEDVAEWFQDQGFMEIADRVRSTSLNGRQILGLKENAIIDIIGLEDEDERKEISLRLYWLKKDTKRNSWPVNMTEDNVPHQFLCPITHEIMSDPVICSDGFTYERGAITEWLLSGRFTSPMTNEPLRDTKFLPNNTLKNNICKFLYGEEVSD